MSRALGSMIELMVSADSAPFGDESPVFRVGYLDAQG